MRHLRWLYVGLLLCTLCSCADPYGIIAKEPQPTRVSFSAKEVVPAAAPAVESPSETKQVQQQVPQDVYWVTGSEVYHTDPFCTALHRSSCINSGTLQQAEFAGALRECKRCLSK